MTANLKAVIGYHCQLKHSIAFHGNKTILYLAGQMCIIQNLETGQQKFSLLPELSKPTAIACGPKNMLAIADSSDGSRVSVYDIEAHMHKSLPNPDVSIEEYTYLCFSSDYKYLAAQGCGPNWPMVVWLWDKKLIRTVFLPSNIDEDTDIREISFNPRDNDQMVAVGKQYLRLYKFEEDEGFKPFILSKYETSVANLCIGWLPRERLAIGNEDGQVIMFDGIEQRYEIRVELPHQASKKEVLGKDESEERITSAVSLPVTCLVTTSKGLLCTWGNDVVVEYLRTDDNKDYKFERSFHLPPKEFNIQKELGEIEAEVEAITDIKVGPEEEYLAVSTSTGQIYYSPMASLNMTHHGKKLTFLVLTQPVHKDAIIGLDIAIKRPLLVTCSKQMVKLWDYIDWVQRMQKKFYDEILSLAIHPLGEFVVISFISYTRVFIILNDSLQEVALLRMRDCTETSFSRNGHLLALSDKSRIVVYRFLTMEKIMELKGHHGMLCKFAWTKNDDILVSGDSKGAIYVWDVNTKRRMYEHVVLNTAYSGICIDPDGKNIYAVGTDRTIREIHGSEILKEAPMDVEVTALTLSYSGQMLYGGTVKGCLRAFKFPLTPAAASVDTQVHMGSVTDVKFAHRDMCLVSVGEDGMIAIWETASKDKEMPADFFTSVLIDKDQLRDHFSRVKDLRCELKETKFDAKFQLSLIRMQHDEDKRNIVKDLESKIASLNATITGLSTEKKSLISSYEEEISRLKEANMAAMDKLELQTREKVLSEYDRYNNLLATSQAEKSELQSEIEELQEKNVKLRKDLTEHFEKEIAKKEEVIEKELEKAKEREKHYLELWRQIKAQSAAEVSEMKARLARELQLKDEEIDRLTETNETATKKILYQEQDISCLESEIKERLKEQEKLRTVIAGFEKDIEEAEKHIHAKDTTIQDLQERIFTQNQEKQELEKYVFVANHSYSVLKSEIDPKDEEIKKLKKVNEQLNADLEATLNTLRKHRRDVELVTERTKSLEKELKTVKLKSSRLETAISRYKFDLSSCADLIQNPKRLRENVEKLLAKYGEDREQMNAAADLHTELHVEFNQQRAHLEKTISVLRKRLEKDNQVHRAEHVKMVQENLELIKTINELRQDLKIANRRIQDIEAGLGLTKAKTASEGSITRQKLESVVAAVRRDEDEYNAELTKKDAIIDAQQEEIRRLHALLVVKQDGRIVEEII